MTTVEMAAAVAAAVAIALYEKLASVLEVVRTSSADARATAGEHAAAVRQLRGGGAAGVTPRGRVGGRALEEYMAETA